MVTEFFMIPQNANSPHFFEALKLMVTLATHTLLFSPIALSVRERVADTIRNLINSTVTFLIYIFVEIIRF